MPPFQWVFVRTKGLEPPRLSALDPKSSAATNYATSAGLICECKGTTFFDTDKTFFSKKIHTSNFKHFTIEKKFSYLYFSYVF